MKMKIYPPLIISVTLFCLFALAQVIIAQTPTPTPAQDDGRGISREMTQTQQPVSWPSGPKRFALIIGVDRYDDTQITTLGGAAQQFEQLKQTLPSDVPPRVLA